jgi:hypothetical protein
MSGGLSATGATAALRHDDLIVPRLALGPMPPSHGATHTRPPEMRGLGRRQERDHVHCLTERPASTGRRRPYLLWPPSDVAQDLRRRVRIALPRARRVVEPVALLPGRFAGLMMPLTTRLASLVARWRLRCRRIRRARQGSLDPGQQRHQGLLRDDRTAWLGRDCTSPRQPPAASLDWPTGAVCRDLQPCTRASRALTLPTSGATRGSERWDSCGD